MFMEHNKLSAPCSGAHILQDMGWDLWGGYEQTTVPQWDPEIRGTEHILSFGSRCRTFSWHAHRCLVKGWKERCLQGDFSTNTTPKMCFVFSWECLTWLAGQEPWGTRWQDEVTAPLLVLTSAERCWTAPRRRLTRRGPCTTRWSRARLAQRCPDSC